MKRIKQLKSNRLLVMAGIAIVGVLLYLFGGHAHAETLAAAPAAIALTEEEGKDLSEAEKKFMLSVKKMTADYVAGVTKGAISKEEAQQLMKDFKPNINFKELQEYKELEEEFKKLDKAVKEQGKVIGEMKAGGADEPLSFMDAWNENLKAINAIRETGSGFKRFYFGDYVPEKKQDGSEKESPKNAVYGIKTLFGRKVAAVTSVSNSTASNPTNVTNPYSPFPQQLPEVVFVRRNPNLALNFVDRGTTNSAVMTWTEEGNSEGDAAIVAEGALKPLQDKKFIDRITKAKKVAGHFILTEEMENDTPRLATAVRRLFEENVMRKYDDFVYADIVAAAPGYVSTALDDQIDNADDYAAIGAAIVQLITLNANPDLIVMNPADRWRMRLTKSVGDGQYLLPPFTVGDNSYDGINVALSNKVTPGNFLIGEAKTYKVDEYKPFSIRVGWQNDDLVKNQMTVVGEIRYHSYIATNNLVAWCYASYNAVKAQIEKP